MDNFRVILCVLVLVQTLSGCTSIGMNSQFSCGVGQGLGCKSVSEVSQIVDAQHDNSSQSIKAVAEGQYKTLSYVDGYFPATGPTREPEKKIKVWFSPHVDESGNYVEEMVVYAVVQDAYWKN